MYQGKTTFSRISTMVNRDEDEHRISSRVKKLKEKHEAHLKELGVRVHEDKPLLPGDIPPEQRKLYKAAYEALKNSNKSWATEDEIKSILYADKEMTHARSAEVIEILRRARVPGFRETDEVTAGDVYSERVLDAIEEQEREQKRADQRERINKITDRDHGTVKDMDIDAEGSDGQPARHFTNVRFSPDATNERSFTHREQQDQLAQQELERTQVESFTKSLAELAQAAKEEQLKKEKNKGRPTSVPLTDVLDDMDI